MSNVPLSGGRPSLFPPPIPRQALKLDLTNGHSWYIVGNAYLALFFGIAQSKDYLQQARETFVLSRKGPLALPRPASQLLPLKHCDAQPPTHAPFFPSSGLCGVQQGRQ